MRPYAIYGIRRARNAFVQMLQFRPFWLKKCTRLRLGSPPVEDFDLTDRLLNKIRCGKGSTCYAVVRCILACSHLRKFLVLHAAALAAGCSLLAFQAPGRGVRSLVQIPDLQPMRDGGLFHCGDCCLEVYFLSFSSTPQNSSSEAKQPLIDLEN